MNLNPRPALPPLDEGAPRKWMVFGVAIVTPVIGVKRPIRRRLATWWNPSRCSGVLDDVGLVARGESEGTAGRGECARVDSEAVEGLDRGTLMDDFSRRLLTAAAEAYRRAEDERAAGHRAKATRRATPARAMC